MSKLAKAYIHLVSMFVCLDLSLPTPSKQGEKSADFYTKAGTIFLKDTYDW